MRRSDLKKKERYVTKRERPTGYPAELITLKNGTVVGGYGVRNRNEKWERLVDDGWLKNIGVQYKKLSWITSKQIKTIEAWTPKRQAALEQSAKYETRLDQKQEEQKTTETNQSKLAFATTKMLFIVNAGGKEVRLLSDFKGNIINSGENAKTRHKTVTDYLQELTMTYGEDKVSYEYKMR